MSGPSGVGMVEVAVLESVAELGAYPKRPHIKCTKVVDAVEERIGLAPGYAYEILLDLARPWTVPIRLIDFHGNYGSRDFPAASPRYVECRLSHAGQLVLQAEGGEIAPIPVGLINGNTHRGGRRPPLNPRRAIAVLRRLIANPRRPDSDVLDIIGPPDLLTGCQVAGDFEAYASGRPTALRLTGEVIVEDPRRVTIRTLPPNASPREVMDTIQKRLKPPSWGESHPSLDDATRLPVADIRDLSSGHEMRLVCLLPSGVDAELVKHRLEKVGGVMTELPVELKTPLATTLRSWVKQHRDEDIANSLDRLEEAL